jgi:hypothetical protein
MPSRLVNELTFHDALLEVKLSKVFQDFKKHYYSTIDSLTLSTGFLYNPNKTNFELNEQERILEAQISRVFNSILNLEFQLSDTGIRTLDINMYSATDITVTPHYIEFKLLDPKGDSYAIYIDDENVIQIKGVSYNIDLNIRVNIVPRNSPDVNEFYINPFRSRSFSFAKNNNGEPIILPQTNRIYCLRDWIPRQAENAIKKEDFTFINQNYTGSPLLIPETPGNVEKLIAATYKAGFKSTVKNMVIEYHISGSQCKMIETLKIARNARSLSQSIDRGTYEKIYKAYPIYTEYPLTISVLINKNHITNHAREMAIACKYVD